MNDVENYDELSVADIVRRVVRTWWLVLGGLVVGATVAWLTTDDGGTSKISRRVDLAFVDYSGAAEALGLPPDVVAPPLPSAEVGRANQVAVDLDLPDTSLTVTAFDQQQTLRVSASAPSEDEVVDGTAKFVEAYRAAVVSDFVAGLDVVEEFARAEVATLTERRAAIASDLGDASNAALESELLVLNERINDAESQVRAAQRVAELVQDRLLTEGNSVVTTTQLERFSGFVVVGAVLGALAMVALIVSLAIVDRKIRRRQQVARLLPGVPLLGVLGRTGSDPARADLEAAVRHRLAQLDADHVEVRTVGPRGATSSFEGVPRTGDAPAVLLVCSYGKVSEDQLTGEAQAIVLQGRPLAGVVLVDVPERELAWASAGFEPAALRSDARSADG